MVTEPGGPPTTSGAVQPRGLRPVSTLRLATDTSGWDDIAELELATLSWVHWFNEQRLHSHCHDVPPAELETAFYAAQQADPEGVGIR